MIPRRNQSVLDSSEFHPETSRAFKAFYREIWLIPAMAAVVAILILVIEHARMPQIGQKFLTSFIYAMLIGFPAALILNWVGFRYTQRFPRLVFVFHVGVLLITATLGSMAGALIIQIAGIIPPGFYWRELQTSFPVSLVITLVVGLAITAYETLRHRLQDTTLELRTRQVEQERANKLLVEARLSSLESRIHPHFLFNTLNSIASLIPSDPRRAEDMVGKLSSLLRFSISSNQTSLVPLTQELKIVRAYLDIESTRFGQRLHYEISVPERFGDFKVPPLSLQTLVENSVKHVVAQCSKLTSIKVGCAQQNGNLELSVTDDGPGFSLANIAPDHGLGNLVARLEFLFGTSAHLDVNRIGDRTVVAFAIPTGEPQ